MQRKTGVLIFTHGSRLKEGNEIMVKLVDQVRQRLGYDLIEPCFMELGKPLIPSPSKNSSTAAPITFSVTRSSSCRARTCAKTSRLFSSRH